MNPQQFPFLLFYSLQKMFQIIILIIDFKKMTKQRGKVGKYSKISLQKKFQLLKLTQLGKISLKQTSERLRINYSTAKTISFQFQNNKIKNKLKFFEVDSQIQNLKRKEKKITLIATYKEKLNQDNNFKQIKVICTQKSLKSIKNTQILSDNIKQVVPLYENINQINCIKNLYDKNQKKLQKQTMSNNYSKNGEVNSEKNMYESIMRLSLRQQNNQENESKRIQGNRELLLQENFRNEGGNQNQFSRKFYPFYIFFP